MISIIDWLGIHFNLRYRFLLKIKVLIISYNKMYQIQLKFKAQLKKITIAKSLASN